MAKHTIMVAGTYYRQPALAKLMHEKNYYYSCSKNELLEEGFDEEDRIYQYEQEECELAIFHEPDNPYDPAALQVFADGEFIGYVPKGNLKVLRDISEKPGLQMSVVIFGGKYKCLEYNEDDDIFDEYSPKFFRLTTVSNTYAAMMVFEW